MIKSLSPKPCAFDCEWTPCPATLHRLLDLPADECTVTENTPSLGFRLREWE